MNDGLFRFSSLLSVAERFIHIARGSLLLACSNLLEEEAEFLILSFHSVKYLSTVLDYSSMNERDKGSVCRKLGEIDVKEYLACEY